MVFFILVLLLLCSCEADCVDLTVRSNKKAAQKVMLWVVPEKDETVPLLVDHMVRALSFTKQCELIVEQAENFPSSSDLKKIKNERDIFLVLAVAPCEKGYAWRLYDTIVSKMHVARRYEKTGSELRGWAYALCDDIWPLLMKSKGFFSTKIAYEQGVKGENCRHIYIADFDGSHAERLIATSTVNIAPRWNYDRKNPMLFYSTNTPKNLRMMAIGTDKKTKVTSNYDGQNIAPSFCKDGSKMVYCCSRGDGRCQIYLCEKSNIKNLTNNMSNNISPSLSPDGTKVYFCSDAQTGRSDLFVYDMQNDELERLSTGIECSASRYNALAERVVYARTIDGVQQLYLYDVKTRKHEALTGDASSKQGCSWSPCGNFILFSEKEEGKSSRLAMINVHDKSKRYVSAEGEDCAFPDWSPVYREFPIFC